MTPRLQDGVHLAHAIQRLDELARDARNVIGGTVGNVEGHKNRYLVWVGPADTGLRGIFTDPTTWEALYDERYWRIRDLAHDSSRPIELINQEAELQARRLGDLAIQLKQLMKRLTVAPGQLTLLDTNVLLHFLPPTQVDWPKVVDAPQVRLVLPLRVIEELDEKKYTARDDLADRARRLLSQLRAQLAPTAGAPPALLPGVTIEVPVDDGPRRRTLDADQEILDTCRELGFGGQPVILVTDDTGMTLRAMAQGTRVVPMPEEYLRKGASQSRGTLDSG